VVAGDRPAAAADRARVIFMAVL